MFLIRITSHTVLCAPSWNACFGKAVVELHSPKRKAIKRKLSRLVYAALSCETSCIFSSLVKGREQPGRCGVKVHLKGQNSDGTH